MSTFRFGVTARLGLGFGVMLVLMLGLTWMSIVQVDAVNRDLAQINEVNSVKQRYAINYRGSVHDRAIAIRDVVITSGDQRQNAIALIGRLADDYARNEVAMIAMVASVGASATETEVLARIADIQSRANPLVGTVIADRQAGRNEAAHTALAELSPLFDDWLAAINVFIDYQENLNQAVGKDVRAIAGNFQILALVALSVAALIALCAAYFVSRSIIAPLGRLGGAMREMADGNYDLVVPCADCRDEVGDMARTVEVFRVNGQRIAEINASEATRLAALDAKGQIDAMARSQAVISFAPDGTILEANENFCRALGYRLEEIRGRHHSMFVVPEEARGADYRAFWQALGRGESQIAEFRRVGRNGREVWIQASYNPIVDAAGKVYKVVKFAIDVTGRKAAVNHLREGLARLAEGDLTARIDTGFIAELEDVRHAFNSTVERFSGIVANLRTTSGALRTATGEILSGANDLSDRTTRQASTIEEISGAIEQLAAAVSGSAAEAEQASTVAETSSVEAQDGGRMMAEATSAMERITQSSSRVADIIGVIDQIAFQTNLLALNASVEAARAGDAGKSFAVVAGEVRTLAQSVARSSEEVKQLVQVSADQVKTGAQLVRATSDKLSSLLDGTQQTARRLVAIARQNREQASAIKHVNTAVRQMEEMTQHNAALVEETNAAIEQTEAQAGSLDRIVGVFRVEDAPLRETPPSDARALQGRVRQATARRYLSQGNAAVEMDRDRF